MLPYQAVAMDYAVASAGFHHHQRQAGLPGMMGLPGSVPTPGAGLNPAFTHSWFVQSPTDMCRQQQQTNQNHLEPGILELRKEKSRDAARSRRGKENYEFYELAKMLPLPAAITSQLDKASIIRLTISYLKLRDFSGHGDPPWSRDMPASSKTLKGAQNRRTSAGLAMELFEQHQGTHILQSLDGFALSVAADGRFLYISETVSIYLGLSQVEMTGSSIFDYVHQADHAEIAEHLGLSLTGSGTSRASSGGGLHSPGSGASEEGSQQGTNNPDVSAQMNLATSSLLFKGMDRAFCIRMKSTLTKRGCHFKSSGYRVGRTSADGTNVRNEDCFRVVLLLCRLRPQYTFSHSRKSQPVLLGMVALAIALPPPSVHEIRLESDMFVTRITFDFRIAHCEPRVSELLGYTAEEITGKNLYSLCHGEDANKLRKCHIDLMSKGQVLTHYYRIMNKLGGYTWVQTCATVVCSSKNADEQNVICVNYVISGREYPNIVMDCCQLEENVQGVKREETTGDPENGSPDADKSTEGSRSGLPGPLPPRCSPQPDGNDSPEHRPDRSSDVTQLSQITSPLDQPQPLVVASNKMNRSSVEKDVSPLSTRKPKKRKLVQNEEENSNTPDNAEPACLPQNPKTLPLAMRGILSPNNTAPCSTAPHVTTNQDMNPVNAKPAMPIAEPVADTTSVKDLENAMSKHLPTSILNVDKDTHSASAHQPTDFSTDTLLKQQQQKSTIQWIGAQNHLSHLNQQLQHGHSAVASMPASALLRQLYANRESVIRTNVLGITSGSSRVGSAAGFYANDGQVGPLPTPPGSEGSSTYGDHQFINLHNQKPNSDAFSNLVSSYGSSSSYAMDYHSAMTPPSSVSPRDKQQSYSHPGVAFDNSSVYTDVLRHSYLGSNNETPAQPLPLKPQVYSAMHGALDYASSTLDQSQFFHGTPNSGFHLYHPASNKTGPPTSNWYSTTS